MVKGALFVLQLPEGRHLFCSGLPNQPLNDSPISSLLAGCHAGQAFGRQVQVSKQSRNSGLVVDGGECELVGVELQVVVGPLQWGHLLELLGDLLGVLMEQVAEVSIVVLVGNGERFLFLADEQKIEPLLVVVQLAFDFFGAEALAFQLEVNSTHEL